MPHAAVRCAAPCLMLQRHSYGVSNASRGWIDCVRAAATVPSCQSRVRPCCAVRCVPLPPCSATTAISFTHCHRCCRSLLVAALVAALVPWRPQAFFRGLADERQLQRYSAWMAGFFAAYAAVALLLMWGLRLGTPGLIMASGAQGHAGAGAGRCVGGMGRAGMWNYGGREMRLSHTRAGVPSGRLAPRPPHLG